MQGESPPQALIAEQPLLWLCYRNSEGKTEGRGKRCEDQGFVLQPQVPPAWLHLLGYVYRRIWFSLQGSFEDRNFVSFRGNLTKSSTPNVLPWGYRSPNTQTGCPAIRSFTTYLLCHYPRKALVSPEVLEHPLFLLQSVFQLPALFPSAVLSSVSWSGHATWGPRETTWPINLCITGAEASGAAGQPRGRIRRLLSLSAPRYERTCG